jgi:hypothetical protein
LVTKQYYLLANYGRSASERNSLQKATAFLALAAKCLRSATQRSYSKLAIVSAFAPASH